jgi:hypothetical protein
VGSSYRVRRRIRLGQNVEEMSWPIQSPYAVKQRARLDQEREKAVERRNWPF